MRRKEPDYKRGRGDCQHLGPYYLTFDETTALDIARREIKEAEDAETLERVYVELGLLSASGQCRRPVFVWRVLADPAELTRRLKTVMYTMDRLPPDDD